MSLKIVVEIDSKKVEFPKILNAVNKFKRSKENEGFEVYIQGENYRELDKNNCWDLKDNERDHIVKEVVLMLLKEDSYEEWKLVQRYNPILNVFSDISIVESKKIETRALSAKVDKISDLEKRLTINYKKPRGRKQIIEEKTIYKINSCKPNVFRDFGNYVGAFLSKELF